MRQILVFALVTILAAAGVAAFDPSTCRSGVTSMTSNGLEILVDAQTEALLATSSSEMGGKTFQEALDDATSRARIAWREMSPERDPLYEKMFKSVPFRMEDVSWGEHFFYSVSSDLFFQADNCKYTDAQCVVTQLPARLIRDIYGGGKLEATLLLHEYAHALHLALPSSTAGSSTALDAAQKAIDAAYDNYVKNIYPGLDKPAFLPPPSPEGGFGKYESWWYSTANVREYFAVTSEGYANYGNASIGKWPENRAGLKRDDPQGCEAVEALWKLSASDLQAGLDYCAANGGSSAVRNVAGGAAWLASALLLSLLW